MSKSSYNKFSDYTYLDETAWDFCYKLCQDIIGKKGNLTFDDWSFLFDESNDALKNYEIEDKENILPILGHVILAERGFSYDNPDLNLLSDTELVTFYAKIESIEKKQEIISHLGSIYSPDENLNYYYLLSQSLMADEFDKEKLSQSIANLAKKYFDNEITCRELRTVYASSLIVLGNLKKGLAMFDIIIEEDKLNIRPYVQICEILAFTERNDIAKKYLSLAIETAYSIDDEQLASDLIEIFNQFFQEELIIHETLNPNTISLEDVIEDNLADKEKVILKEIENKHPEEMEILLYNKEEDKLNKAYGHIKSHAKIEMIIASDKDSIVFKKFKELRNRNVPEHKAIHALMDKFIED